MYLYKTAHTHSHTHTHTLSHTHAHTLTHSHTCTHTHMHTHTHTPHTTHTHTHTHTRTHTYTHTHTHRHTHTLMRVFSPSSTPFREDEERRIKNLGGEVIHWGRWRVQGVLAVSRYNLLTFSTYVTISYYLLPSPALTPSHKWPLNLYECLSISFFLNYTI